MCAKERDTAMEAACSVEDPLKRALYVIGVWSARLAEKEIKPVVVGGKAVEFYTFGAYATRDVDVVCPGRVEAIKELENLGFTRTESKRHWYHKALQLIIEIPDEALAGSWERLAEIEVMGQRTLLIGIEDLVLDRLRAHVYWRSESDGEWARRLLSIHGASIDWAYLEEQADRENLGDVLRSLRSQHFDT